MLCRTFYTQKYTHLVIDLIEWKRFFSFYLLLSIRAGGWSGGNSRSTAKSNVSKLNVYQFWICHNRVLQLAMQHVRCACVCLCRMDRTHKLNCGAFKWCRSSRKADRSRHQLHIMFSLELHGIGLINWISKTRRLCVCVDSAIEYWFGYVIYLLDFLHFLSVHFSLLRLQLLLFSVRLFRGLLHHWSTLKSGAFCIPPYATQCNSSKKGNRGARAGGEEMEEMNKIWFELRSFCQQRSMP